MHERAAEVHELTMEIRPLVCGRQFTRTRTRCGVGAAAGCLRLGSDGECETGGFAAM